MGQNTSMYKNTNKTEKDKDKNNEIETNEQLLRVHPKTYNFQNNDYSISGQILGKV